MDPQQWLEEHADELRTRPRVHNPVPEAYWRWKSGGSCDPLDAVIGQAVDELNSDDRTIALAMDTEGPVALELLCMKSN